jgi:hypothetical protein
VARWADRLIGPVRYTCPQYIIVTIAGFATGHASGVPRSTVGLSGVASLFYTKVRRRGRGGPGVAAWREWLFPITMRLFNIIFLCYVVSSAQNLDIFRYEGRTTFRIRDDMVKM